MNYGVTVKSTLKKNINVKKATANNKQKKFFFFILKLTINAQNILKKPINKNRWATTCC